MPKRESGEKQAYWLDVCNRFEASGKTMKDFCRDEGVQVNNVNYWRRKFGMVNSKFDRPKTVEMPFPCGITLVLREGCDPGVLQRVLAALNGEDR